MEELEGQLNLDDAPVLEIRLTPPYQGPWPPQPPSWGDDYAEWSRHMEFRYTQEDEQARRGE